MFRRAIWLFLLLVASQLSTGCWCCCHRPFFFRRCCCYNGATCCGSSEVGATHMDYAQPPMAPMGPNMPSATPLTRR